MKVYLKIPLVLVALLVAVAMSEGVRGSWTQYKAEAIEIAQLPSYCWAQYLADKQSPEYSVNSKGCGPGMNHYCPGLVELMRAKRSFGDRRKRLGHLETAKDNTLYTMTAMKDYPGCSLRADVEKTLNEINVYLRAFGHK
jgi:hypothetical protein